MTPQTIETVETTFAALRPQGELLVSRFYDRLFEAHPAVRPLFRADVGAQRAALLGALDLAVAHLRRTDVLVPVLRDLGRRHVRYGVEEAHYTAVRDVMLATLQELAGEGWTDEAQAAWEQTLDLVANVMISGARGEA